MPGEEKLSCEKFETALLAVETTRSQVHEWLLENLTKHLASVEALATVVIEHAAVMEAGLAS